LTSANPTSTDLTLTDILPLTCTRLGTCCHGKMVWLNPWELARLALAKGMTPREFRDRHCEFGGIRLRFDNPAGWNNLAACSQYLPNCGCSVHAGRPLVCRLYPLGRKRHGDDLVYMHEGRRFPCLDGCPNVASLPQLTVADYLAGQDVAACISAHDEYLELMQQLADGAFVLLLETGLAASGDRETLRLWRKLGNYNPEELAQFPGAEWIDRLMLPQINDDLDDPVDFCHTHHDAIQSHAQLLFGKLDNGVAMCEASGIMMGLALHLGRGLGANPVDLVEHWILAARKFGAEE